MTDGSIFEDFLYLLKARDEKTMQNRALIFTLLNDRGRKGEKLRDIKERLEQKSLEENIDAAVHNLAGRRGVKYSPVDLDDGKLCYGIFGNDNCEYDLYVLPENLIQYELKVSTAWNEKSKQEYAGVELSKKVNTIEFFEDLKILKEKGVRFEDVGKILNKKYQSITWYRPQTRTHYLEGVLSAQPGALSDTDNDQREIVDYCTSLEFSQTKKDNGQNTVIAVLTINTKWNFLKKK